jgi:hypothetical protein
MQAMIRASSVVRILAVGPSWNVAPSMGISVGAVAIVSGATMRLTIRLLLSQLIIMGMGTWIWGRTMLKSQIYE